MIAHDNPTRNFDNIALRIRSVAPDIVMMSNYQNEYVLLARTLYQQKVNLAGMFSVLGGGFNYKFAKEQPEVSQYMMDCNHWYNPKSEKAQALKKRVEAAGKEFTFEVYLAYNAVRLIADALTPTYPGPCRGIFLRHCLVGECALPLPLDLHHVSQSLHQNIWLPDERVRLGQDGRRARRS